METPTRKELTEPTWKELTELTWKELANRLRAKLDSDDLSYRQLVLMLTIAETEQKKH